MSSASLSNMYSPKYVIELIRYINKETQTFSEDYLRDLNIVILYLQQSYTSRRPYKRMKIRVEIQTCDAHRIALGSIVKRT